MDKRKIPNSSELLSQAFHFDDETLRINRTRHLTSKQLKWLALAPRLRFQWAILMVLIAAILTLPILTSFSSASDTRALLFLIAGLILAAAYLSFRAHRLSLDLRGKQVAVIEGIIRLDTGNDYAPVWFYSIRIQNLKFYLSHSQFSP